MIGVRIIHVYRAFPPILMLKLGCVLCMSKSPFSCLTVLVVVRIIFEKLRYIGYALQRYLEYVYESILRRGGI